MAGFDKDALKGVADKAKGAVGGNRDKIEGVADQAIDKVAKGEKGDKAKDALRSGLDKLEGQLPRLLRPVWSHSAACCTLFRGGVSERPKVLASKASVGKTTGGSNPSATASNVRPPVPCTGGLVVRGVKG